MDVLSLVVGSLKYHDNPSFNTCTVEWERYPGGNWYARAVVTHGYLWINR